MTARGCIAVLALVLASAAPAVAAENQTREAGKHFQRGVDLYTDGDFRGALVEFKKAYATWPRANVLYDIGQTEYQLLDYAAALKTMERYLAETGPNAAHRSEVEGTVEILRGRVGKVVLSADVADCEVTVDEQPAGTTPLSGPILVSVGPRRITLNCPNRPSVSRRIELVAGELSRLEIKVPPPTVAAVRSAATPLPKLDQGPTRTGVALGWTVSALLAAATIGTGAATLVGQNRLNDLKASYPVQRDQLDREAQTTTALAISTDVIGVAALVAIGASTWVTVKYMKSQKKVRLGFTGDRLLLNATF
jgi:hypothetical protein